MEHLAAALIMLFVLGFGALMVYQKHHGRMERRRLQLEAQSRLLDRIGPGDALTAFLQTEEGKALLKSYESFDEPDKPVHRRHDGIRMSVITLSTAGVICIGIGAGFMYAANIAVEHDLYIPAGIVAGVGVGCIVAALIHYILGKAWGMLGNGREQDSSRSRQL
jgi:hypothetical protein